MRTPQVSSQAVSIAFEAPEIYRILTALEGLEERGQVDPALQGLQEKLNEALPFSASFFNRITESD